MISVGFNSLLLAATFYCRFGFSRTSTAEAEPTYKDAPSACGGVVH